VITKTIVLLNFGLDIGPIWRFKMGQLSFRWDQERRRIVNILSMCVRQMCLNQQCVDVTDVAAPDCGDCSTNGVN